MQPRCNLTNLTSISWQAEEGRGGGGGQEREREREKGGEREIERADSLSAHDKRTGEDDERDNN